MTLTKLVTDFYQWAVAPTLSFITFIIATRVDKN
jgi:hypothetical protein